LCQKFICFVGTFNKIILLITPIKFIKQYVMNKKSKLKLIISRFLLLSAIFLILIFFVLEVYALIVQKESQEPLPPLFGNFPHIRDTLEKQGQKEEFSFAVIGDTRSVGTFERIVQELRNIKLDFAVLLGDCSYKGTEGEHNFFRAECVDEYALPFPVFYIVGNHDVSMSDFTISRFEKVYGPSIFSFEYQGCLFIALRILNEPYSNEQSFEFLRAWLKKQPEKYKKRFVFMHIPPPISEDFESRKFTGSENLVKLFDELKIDYVFAGDFHGHARVKLGDVVYIITGGGGAHLRESRSKQFHHAFIMRVDKNGVNERFIPVDRENHLEDRLERLAIARVYPWLSSNRLAASLINAAVLIGLIGMLWLLVRNGRNVRLSRKKE